MTRFRFILATLVLTAFTVSLTPAQGQNLTSSYEMKVKAGSGAAFEEAIKSHMEYRQANGDPWEWSFYQVAVGDNIGTYFARSGEHSWADFDAYDAAEFNQPVGYQWMATVEPFVEKASNIIERAELELSRLPDSPDAYSHFNVTNFFLKPDQQSAFFEAIGKFRQAMVDADFPLYFLVSFPAAGGEGPMASIVGFSENWAGFDEDDSAIEEMMLEAYGEEEAMEIFNQFAGSYHYLENFIVIHRPDLSGGEM